MPPKTITYFIYIFFYFFFSSSLFFFFYIFLANLLSAWTKTNFRLLSMTNYQLWEIWINEILYECFLCIGLNVCAWYLLTPNPTILVWLTPYPFRFRSILFLRSFVVHTAKPQSATLGCWFYSTKCIALS